jgi:hypothetical protein
MFDKFWYDYDDCIDITLLFEHARANSRTEYVWLCHRSVDYSNFNWHWMSIRHQKNFYHAWPSHHNTQCYTTWLIPVNVEWSQAESVFHNENILPVKTPLHGELWHWATDDRIDYTDFNFNWFPSVWDWNMSHAFTMNGKEQLSYTRLLNRSPEVKYHWAGLAYGEKYYDTCLLDTGVGSGQTHDFRVRLVTTMEEAIKNAVRKCKSPWLWIVADCCDYTAFDFGWLPDADQEHQVHCWPSGTCEKGDTFLIYVPQFINNEVHTWNFNHTAVPRKQWPVVYYNQDSLATALHKKSSAIYTLFSNQEFDEYIVPDVCLWEKRPVVSLSADNSISLVPRDCLAKDEIYEYPYLDKTAEFMPSSYSDIVFISYDEPDADKNYEELRGFENVKRVHGVEGMENALKAAARASNTPWFYAVFAKTRVHRNFNFNFTPDYWQKPKHYIFYSRNMVNNLEYGHMGIIMYNAKMVLNAPEFGVFGTDYTLSFDHAVVPIISCYGVFDQDPYHTWRTAFRESHKLKEFSETTPSVETDYRLYVWQNVAHGQYSEWALRGARDGAAFYEKYRNDPEYRKNTFRWEWLRDYFKSLHGEVNE